jgi:hypothetical protein
MPHSEAMPPLGSDILAAKRESVWLVTNISIATRIAFLTKWLFLDSIDLLFVITT